MHKNRLEREKETMWKKWKEYKRSLETEKAKLKKGKKQEEKY